MSMRDVQTNPFSVAFSLGQWYWIPSSHSWKLRSVFWIYKTHKNRKSQHTNESDLFEKHFWIDWYDKSWAYLKSICALHTSAYSQLNISSAKVVEWWTDGQGNLCRSAKKENNHESDERTNWEKPFKTIHYCNKLLVLYNILVQALFTCSRNMFLC